MAGKGGYQTHVAGRLSSAAVQRCCFRRQQGCKHSEHLPTWHGCVEEPQLAVGAGRRKHKA